MHFYANFKHSQRNNDVLLMHTEIVIPYLDRRNYLTYHTLHLSTFSAFFASFLIAFPCKFNTLAINYYFSVNILHQFTGQNRITAQFDVRSTSAMTLPCLKAFLDVIAFLFCINNINKCRQQWKQNELNTVLWHFTNDWNTIEDRIQAESTDGIIRVSL